MYRIECLLNGKRYHGQTINPKERWPHHLRADSHCHALRNALKKHGADNFVFSIIEKASSKEELDELEKKWVSTSVSPNGYNLKEGGANGRPSAETRRRMSEASKRSQNRPEVRKKNSDGVKRAFATPEMKARLSAAGKARMARPTERERHCAMLKEVHARPDQKKLRSEALKASWGSYTPEAREARIQGLRDTFTPERRARVSAKSRETMSNPEVKAKHKEALKKALSAPEVVAAKSARMKKIHAQPGEKERRGAAISAALNIPEVKQRRRAKILAAYNTPEVKAKLAARRRRGESLEAWKQRLSDQSTAS